MVVFGGLDKSCSSGVVGITAQLNGFKRGGGRIEARTSVSGERWCGLH